MIAQGLDPTLAQLADLPLRRGPQLQTGVVFHPLLGRQAYAHSPWRKDALVLLGPRAEQWVSQADGRPAAAQIAGWLGSAGSGDNQPIPLSTDSRLASWLADVPMLLRNGLLEAPPSALPSTLLPPAKAQAQPRVFNAWLHLTNACNLACPYCYIHKSKRHMSQHVVERVLASIEATAASGEVDRIHVRYAGGEPMLRLDVMQRFHAAALERCAQHGVQFSAAVLTNGTALQPAGVAWLKQAGVSVSVSVDGTGPLQDVMRPVVGGGSSWQRVQAGIDLLLANQIVPYILITVGDSNLAGLPALTAWLLERHLAFRYSLVRDLEWGAGLLNDRSGADSGPQEALQPAPDLLQGPALVRLQGVLGHCYDLIEAHMAAGIGQHDHKLGWFRHSHKFCDLSPWHPIVSACGAGKSYVAIGETGEVSPCQAALHHPGTQPLAGESLLTLARGQTQLQPFVRTAPNSECLQCRHRASCAGGCPLLLHRREGAVNGRSPYCEVFKAVLPRLVRIAALELAGQRYRSQRQPPVHHKESHA